MCQAAIMNRLSLHFGESWLLSWYTPRFPLSSQRLGEFGSLAEPLALEVEDVNRNRDEKRNNGEDRRGPFEMIFVVCPANILVDYRSVRIVSALHSGVHVQGVEYMAATPAKKSRARPLPPVADAAYGP